MLRNLGIRSKLLAVLAVPLIVLIALSSIVVAGAAQTAQRADRVRQLTVAAGLLDQYVHGLQRERSLTSTYLSTGSAKVKTELDAARQVSTQRLAAVRAAVAKAPVAGVSPIFAAAVAKAVAADDQLPKIRAEVDARKAPAATLLGFYTATISLDLDMTDLVALASQSPELTHELQAYSALSHAIESAWQERDLGTAVMTAKKVSQAQYYAFAGLVSIQQAQLSAFTQLADPSEAASLRKVLGNDAAMAAARQQVDVLMATGKPPVHSAWPSAADQRIAAMSSVEPSLVASLAAAAHEATSLAKIKAVATGVGTLTAILILLVLAVAVLRRIVGPIRRLTAAATDTARRLPQMVDEMQTPGKRPDVELPKIVVDSDDEIGGLADAFNVVNDVTMRVAHEQAALRASIAEMFVNVARRNQVLLTRQLNLIDQMEANEEDPDTLDNLFRVDHLATRMRRNAESLLVLAGIDASRRVRNPMPLTDVIRSATSEIENFDRVDLAPAMDAPLTGRYAMTAAHLLAELIENATHFSNPDTRVIVATGPSRDGIEVTITDYGLGMSEKELAEANERIAHPPVTEIAISQRLGFLVVGRLAQRLDAKVHLRRGRTAGTVVSVSLPAEVFVPGSLPHVRPAEDAPVPSDETAAAVPSGEQTSLQPTGVAPSAGEPAYQPEWAIPGAAAAGPAGEPLAMPSLAMPDLAMPDLAMPSRARWALDGGDEAAPELAVQADDEAYDGDVGTDDQEPGVASEGSVVDEEPAVVDEEPAVVDEEPAVDEPAVDEPAVDEPADVTEAAQEPTDEGSVDERPRRARWSVLVAFFSRRQHRQPSAVVDDLAEEAADVSVEEPVAATPDEEPVAATPDAPVSSFELGAQDERPAEATFDEPVPAEATFDEPVPAEATFDEPVPANGGEQLEHHRDTVESQPTASDRFSDATAQLRELATFTAAGPEDTTAEAEDTTEEPVLSAAAEGEAEPTAEPTAEPPVEPVHEEPVHPMFSGAAAMDILPGRHRGPKRNLFHRRHHEGEPAVKPATTPVAGDLPKRSNVALVRESGPALVEPPAATSQPFRMPWTTPPGDSTPPPPWRPGAPAVTSETPGHGQSQPAGLAQPQLAPEGPPANADPTPQWANADPIPEWANAERARTEAAPFGGGLRGSPFAELAAERHLAPIEPDPVEPAPVEPAARRRMADPQPAGGAEQMAARSQLASQALSELSRLNSSSYAPTEASGGPAPLTRRVSRADSVPPPASAEATRPRRTADEVRSRLAGFRAGVERGRNASSSNSHSKS